MLILLGLLVLFMVYILYEAVIYLIGGAIVLIGLLILIGIGKHKAVDNIGNR